MQFSRPELMPVRPLRHRRHRAHPGRRPGDPRRQPPQLLRLRGDVDGHRPQRPHRALPRQEGGVRRAGRRPAGHGDGRHPRRPRHRLRRAAAGRRRRPRRRRGRGDHAAGDDPARPGVLRPRAEGALGRGPAGGDDEGAGHPDRPVGHRAGVAAVEPAAERPQRRRPAAGPRPRRRAGRRSSTARSTPTPSGSWTRSATCCPPRPTASTTPTPEELARTYPPGYKGDPTAESTRRPGTD